MMETAYYKVILAGAIFLTVAFGGPVFATALVERLYSFEVRLNGKEIGQHRFSVSEEDGREIINSSAEFDVTFLRIPVYQYSHQAKEIWQDGCLQRMDSVTDDNGEQSSVSAQFNSGENLIEIIDAEDTRQYQTNCPKSFAYWDKSFLSSGRLLNPQTGQWVEIEVEEHQELPKFEVPVDEQLRGYSIRGDEGEIDIRLWYTLVDDAWKGLESNLPNGRVLQYVVQEPDTPL